MTALKTNVMNGEEQDILMSAVFVMVGELEKKYVIVRVMGLLNIVET